MYGQQLLKILHQACTDLAIYEQNLYASLYMRESTAPCLYYNSEYNAVNVQKLTTIYCVNNTYSKAALLNYKQNMKLMRIDVTVNTRYKLLMTRCKASRSFGFIAKNTVLSGFSLPLYFSGHGHDSASETKDQL